MGKQAGKKKKYMGDKSRNANPRLSEVRDGIPKACDEDTALFILISQELKDEGNKLFQKRDYEGAMLKYEKALKLLPLNHIDVCYLRCKMAACYMQMGLGEYPRAIHECNLALEVNPKYTKACLTRARCYEALDELQLALRDVGAVLKMEPNNLMAKEIADSVKATIEKKDVKTNSLEIDMIAVPHYHERSPALPTTELKEKPPKKSKNVRGNIRDNTDKNKAVALKDEENFKDKKTDDKLVEEKAAEEKNEKKIEYILAVEKNNAEEELEEKTIDDKLVVRDNENEQKVEEKKIEDKLVVKENEDEEKKIEDKLVVEEKISKGMEEEPKRTLKLVFGDDIRCTQVPTVCNVLKLREIICSQFPGLKAVLIKYKDHEGDLITITTNEELKWAEAAAEQHGSLRLYIVDVHPGQDPLFNKVKMEEEAHEHDAKQKSVTANCHAINVKDNGERVPYIDDWIIQFAQLFKNYVGFSSDEYLYLHEYGMKLHTEAMEENVTSEEAQGIFETASDKFQEMAALALFNWGNVHMSRARKRVYFTENNSKESVLVQIKNAYDWAQKEYSKAGERYKEALKIKPDFYEGLVALAQQQFEQAKLSWYYAVAKNMDPQEWPSTDVIQLYNCAEDYMEKGIQMWQEAEGQRLNGFSKGNKMLGSIKLLKDITVDEAAEKAANMRSQLNILWGTMLYERSIMEYKLGLPVWHECLEVAVEKFELAGASPTDIAVMFKNHCSNTTALEGLGFNIDEIVQAWNEMYEAKKWQTGVPSSRLEPLLRRRISNLYHVLEHS